MVTSANGKQGLQMARELSPDLVISDWMMPEMDGPTMIREIKADAVLHSVPIILLTAKAMMRVNSWERRAEQMPSWVNRSMTKS